MKKTFVALSALVVGGGLAASAYAQTTPSTSINYNNDLNAALSAESYNYIDISIAGNIKIKGSVEVDSVGQALVDGKQLLNNNTVWLITPATEESGNVTFVYDNTALLGAFSFALASGNVGINIAAGDNMAQDNAVAIATATGDDEALKADIVKLQEAINNSIVASFNKATVNNVANISNGAFNGAAGNLGANVAAGSNIGQQNSLAVAVAAGTELASANVGVLQRVENNSSQIVKTTNNASVGDIGAGAGGNLGINVAAGSNILQNNALAVTAITP